MTKFCASDYYFYRPIIFIDFSQPICFLPIRYSLWNLLYNIHCNCHLEWPFKKCKSKLLIFQNWRIQKDHTPKISFQVQFLLNCSSIISSLHYCDHLCYAFLITSPFPCTSTFGIALPPILFICIYASVYACMRLCV